MSTVFVTVPFHADLIHAVQDDEGVWVVVKRICQNLGVDDEGQRQRLTRQAWARTAMKETSGPDGKVYEMFCLHVSRLAQWLSTISADRVKKDLRDALTEYQIHCAEVLDAWFRGGGRKTKAKGRKGPFEGPHGQLYELIQAHEGRGPDGERLPWVTTEEEIACRWPGPVVRKKKIKEMLQELVELGWVGRKEAGILVYKFRALTEEERIARGAAATKRQLDLPEPELSR